MIINKVYISAFGKLQDFTYEFNGGLNTILAQNGFGKTTLATFIKVMLYGFSNKAVRDDIKNERKRYIPWRSAGAYGGYIEFTVNNKHLKLEKYFGKTEKDDVVNLYDLSTNKKIGFTGEIGERYFGIDADGFCKSIYFPENENGNFDNESIKVRLNNAIEKAEDCVDYEKAMSEMEKAQKFYYAKKGGGGKIGEINAELNGVMAEIEECKKAGELVKSYEQKLSLLTNDLARLEGEKRKLEAFLQSNQRQLEFIERQKHLKSLENDIDAFNQKLNEYKAFFAKHLPNKEEVARLEDLGEKVAKLEAELKGLMVGESDVLFYKSTQQKYSKITAKNVDNALNLAVSNQGKGGGSNLKSRIVLIALIVSAVLGVVCVALSGNVAVLRLVAIVCFCLAVVLGVVFAITRKKGGKSGRSASAINQIGELLPNIQFNADNLINELIAFKTEFERWQKINTYFQNAGGKINGIKAEYDASLNELNYMLSFYPKYENYAVAISNIKANLDAYNYLLGQINFKKQSMQEFSQGNGYASGESAVNLGAGGVAVGEDVQVQVNRINQNLEDAKNNILQIRHKLGLERERASNLSEFERRKENLKFRLENASEDYKMLSRAIELMQRAKENLNSRYLGPMQANLNGILQSLNTILAKNGAVDTNLGLMIDVDGQLKSSECFSQGYQAILNFCIRLSLVKTLYEGELPFIILDDPFRSVDNNNLRSVNLLLQELAKSYQIIYFVCRNEFAISA